MKKYFLFLMFFSFIALPLVDGDEGLRALEIASMISAQL